MSIAGVTKIWKVVKSVPDTRDILFILKDEFYHKCTHSSQYPKNTCSCATGVRHKHGLQPSGDRKWDFLNLSFACLVSKFVLCERLNNIAATNLGVCHLLCHLVAN